MRILKFICLAGVMVTVAIMAGVWSSTTTAHFQSQAATGPPSTGEMSDFMAEMGIDRIQLTIAGNVPGFGGYFLENERLKVYLTEPGRDSSAVRSSLASLLSDRAFL